MAVWRRGDYLALYADARPGQVCGDASTLYLGSALAARRIRRNIPEAKVTAILRQPAERAYSHFLYWRFNRSVEPLASFSEALGQETIRRQANWSTDFLYRAHGYYYEQLRVYYDLFPREQIKIYLYEDWNTAPQAILRDIFHFLDVDEDFMPVIKRANVSHYPRAHALYRALKSQDRLERRSRWIPASMRDRIISMLQTLDRKYNRLPPPPLDPEIRRQLTRGYREDILRLQDLIGRDLSHWLR